MPKILIETLNENAAMTTIEGDMNDITLLLVGTADGDYTFRTSLLAAALVISKMHKIDMQGLAGGAAGMVDQIVKEINSKKSKQQL